MRWEPRRIAGGCRRRSGRRAQVAAAPQPRVRSLPERHSASCAAARNGHLVVLQWIHEQGAPFDEAACAWDERACSSVAGSSHLAVLQWLHEQNAPWNENTCANAAGGGHLPYCSGYTSRTRRGTRGRVSSPLGAATWPCCSLWLREKGAPWDAERCLSHAETRGHAAIVTWIHAQLQPLSP